jgi:hypothetical protein
MRRVNKESDMSDVNQKVELEGEALVRVSIVRSFAHRSERPPNVDLLPLGPYCKSSGETDAPIKHCSEALEDDTSGRSPPNAPESEKSEMVSEQRCTASLHNGSILSFKEISLELAPLDFTAHESFLTAVFSFVLRLPLQDIWQVRCFVVQMALKSSA